MPHYRWLCSAVFFVLSVSEGVFPAFATAERSIFAVPAVSASKNDGRDFGLIVPVLESDDDGNLVSLMAPLVIHNSFLGVRGTMNYYHYWTAGRQMEFVGSYTEQIERIVEASVSRSWIYSGVVFS